MAASQPGHVRNGALYDAIVVGGGAAGGIAAEKLTGEGLRVLLLDAGLAPSPLRQPLHWAGSSLIRTVADPRFLPFLPARALYAGRKLLRRYGRIRQPVQSLCYAWERLPAAFVDDRGQPYTTPPDRPFVWLRVRALGGRLIVPGHGRQYYRLGPHELYPSDGLSPAWPLERGELDPWYGEVERLLALSGRRDDVPWLPDSELARTAEPDELERELVGKLKTRWPDARPVLGRFAPPRDSVAAARRSGNLTVVTGAAVSRIVRDGTGRAAGVEWIDQRTAKQERAATDLVFLCASALESTRLLLLSLPEGAKGDPSGMLGAHLMDHVLVKAEGVARRGAVDAEPREDGRCVYVPRFDARESAAPGGSRGFGAQIYQSPIGGGKSFFTAVSFGEMLPRSSNRVALDPARRDRWGIPTLHIDCAHGPEEIRMAQQQGQALREIAELAGATLTVPPDAPAAPGTAAHECGTARMGRDPETSVLDPYGQHWLTPGLYVTDGACFPSQGCQNPTLTIMALTARACDHALGRIGSVAPVLAATPVEV